MKLVKQTAAAILVASAFAIPTSAMAEVAEVSVAMQHGLSYLPLMVMERDKLFEKASKAAGADATAKFMRMGGPGPITDALLSGNVQFGAVGVPSLVNLWDKTKNGLGYKAVGALNSLPMYLNTTNPAVRTVCDLKDGDKVALPTVKVSVQAVTLQMAAKKYCGDATKFDRHTVSMSHPDGLLALANNNVTAHFTSPPFMYQELDDKRVRTVLKSYDVLGGKTTFTLVVASTRFLNENPKAYAAFAKGFEQATAWINANRSDAAKFYVEASKTKESIKEVLDQLSNPDIEMTLVPNGIGKYADFMHEIGTIKNKPASWKDMVHPNLHDKKGS